MEKTKVVIRRWPDTGALVALFPEIPGSDPWRTCATYAAGGIRGAADYDHTIRRTTRIWWTGPDEQALLDELARAGYDVELCFRQTDAMVRARLRAAKAPTP